jgi:hypothetical protein
MNSAVAKFKANRGRGARLPPIDRIYDIKTIEFKVYYTAE